LWLLHLAISSTSSALYFAYPGGKLLIHENLFIRHMLDEPQPLLRDDIVGALADIFKVLGDPTRVRILDALSRGERSVCALAGLLRLTESAVSHQLRLLRNTRVVRAR